MQVTLWNRRVYTMNKGRMNWSFSIFPRQRGRKTTLELVSRVAETVNCAMPLTVGGGIREVDDMQNLLFSQARTRSALIQRQCKT